MRDCHLQSRSYIDSRLHIKGYLLPIFVTRGFESSSPEHRGYIDEQRVIGRVFPDTRPPPKAICTVPIIARLYRARNESTMLIQEPLRIETCSVGAIRRRVMVALPEINQANSPLGDEHAFVPIVLGRGVRNA